MTGAPAVFYSASSCSLSKRLGDTRLLPPLVIQSLMASCATMATKKFILLLYNQPYPWDFLPISSLQLEE